MIRRLHIAVLLTATGIGIWPSIGAEASVDSPATTHAIGRDAIEATLPGGETLQIELWYPSQVPPGSTKSTPASGKGDPDFLFSPALKSALVEYIGMPKMAISTKEKGKGRRSVKPASGPWPLVVFSHGFASFSRQNNRQAEALAQAGYVVAALSHPGASLTTEYADGRVEPIDDSHPALQYMGKRAKKSQLLSMAETMNVHLLPLAQATTGDEYLAAMVALRTNTLFGLYQQSAQQRTEQLVEWVQSLLADDAQPTGVLKELDLQRIALYGHSLGGVVSVAAAQTLREQGIAINAAVNLDAPQFFVPNPNSIELAGPTCFLMGGATKAGKIKLHGTGLNSSWANSNAQVCEINIEGAAHNNFTDLSWVSVLKWFGQLGPIPNKKFGDWLNGFLVAYFDHHLKDQPFSYPIWSNADIKGDVTRQEQHAR